MRGAVRQAKRIAERENDLDPERLAEILEGADERDTDSAHGFRWIVVRIGRGWTEWRLVPASAIQ